MVLICDECNQQVIVTTPFDHDAILKHEEFRDTVSHKIVFTTEVKIETTKKRTTIQDIWWHMNYEPSINNDGTGKHILMWCLRYRMALAEAVEWMNKRGAQEGHKEVLEILKGLKKKAVPHP